MLDETKLVDGRQTRISLETANRLTAWKIKLAQKLGEIPSHDRVIATALDALEAQEEGEGERVAA